MLIRLAAVALAALAACAKKQETPAADEAVAAAPAPAIIASPQAGEALAEPEDAQIACPILDARSWKAWTAGAGDGHALMIEGEIDLPTPGYAIMWRAGAADRAMPPGLRVHLDAVAPADLVMQVVTPTPVSWSMDRANERYRVIYVLCGDETIAEIENVGPKAE
jgi:hypothetical protein